MTRRPLALLPLLLLVSLLALVAASCGGDDDDTTAGTTTASGTTNGGGPSECDATIALMAPLTGDAASIGQEQAQFARLAVARYNAERGTSFELVEGDTQLQASEARTVGQRFASNNAVVGVVGPAGSQEVEAVGGVFEQENLAFVSPSATRTDLTSGRFPTFHRVVPRDDAQGPTVATYLTDELAAESVAIIDDQSSYSTGLAQSAAAALRDAGVEVTRSSVTQEQSDFSSVISQLPSDVDAIFLPWQLAAKAQTFGQQLREQGRDVTLFGSDGLFAPEDFRIRGAYVTSFAPDVTGIDQASAVVGAYRTEHGDFGTFGPPTYVATQALLEAVSTACEDGEPTREAVLDALGSVEIESSILGEDISFEESGDIEGARFYVFRVGEDGFELVE